jgi:hypothetical protein
MAICGCQPGVLSNIEYRDIELAVMRDQRIILKQILSEPPLDKK